MNVNTMVEILTHFMDHGDWRLSLQKCIPQRKIHDKEQEQKEYDFRNIQTEEQLMELSTMRITKFEFRKALERYCIQQKLNLTFEKEEFDVKHEPIRGADRYCIRAFVNGELVGEGRGCNTRFASAYCCWRGLKKCGVLERE